MQEFTFIMLTYNQEKYVIEHLESIKYQINTYGKGIKINFLLCDDSSVDRTVQVVRNWIDFNKNLFYSTNIIVSEENNGIVSNVLTALRNVTTDKFKILAGDDLYYKNDIFKVVFNYAFLLTPTLAFNDIGILKEDNIRFKYLIKNSNLQVKNFLKERLKYDNIIEAAGVFYDKSILDKEFFDTVKQYKWIDDVPAWYYLFSKDEFDFKIYSKPLILYRTNVGISNNVKHEKIAGFNEDLRKLNTYIWVNKYKYPKYLNYYTYKYFLLKIFYKYYYNNFNKKIIEFNNNMEYSRKNAVEYLNFIKKSAEKYNQLISI